MTAKDREFVREIVRQTIIELQRAGLLKDQRDTAYTEANDLLKRYYQKGEKDERITAALERIKHDPYFKIIPLNYGYGYTIDEIAQDFGVETSTISRNKKRLCIEILKHL